MYKVTFVNFGQHIASSRLRSVIPQQQLAKLGVKHGFDVVVYGKHSITLDQLRPFGKSVFDVCDSHFERPEVGDYYREHIAAADLVTCNSDTMRKIIELETGHTAVVIPDPYESDEQPAGYSKGVLWFGHQSNLIDLAPYADLKPTILTGSDWSRDKQLDALKRCGVVMIPTGKSMAKSANRLIESVRNGRFVVAGELPAHDEFRQFMWVGDIRTGLEWFKAYPHKAVQQVKECQQYIEQHYSPERIGRLWFEALQCL